MSWSGERPENSSDLERLSRTDFVGAPKASRAANSSDSATLRSTATGAGGSIGAGAGAAAGGLGGGNGGASLAPGT